jgi:hypothetical protein
MYLALQKNTEQIRAGLVSHKNPMDNLQVAAGNLHQIAARWGPEFGVVVLHSIPRLMICARTRRARFPRGCDPILALSPTDTPTPHPHIPDLH